MPAYNSPQNRIADRYERRIKSVGSQNNAHRGRVAVILYNGLRDATQEQLYDKTPLPVTHDMLNSVRPVLNGNVVQVGYFYGPGNVYAKYRVNMTGNAKDGHELDMQPSRYIRDHCDADIKRSERIARVAILEGK